MYNIVKFLIKTMVSVMAFSSITFAVSKRVSGIGTEEINLSWRVVNDTVMGGRSVSNYGYIDGQLYFSGELNTNGGGFASLRSNRLELDLSEFSVVRLKVRGDGRDYRFRLYANNDLASYQSDFSTIDGEWQVIELKIKNFYAAWRGRRLSRLPISSSNIAGIGLIIADGVNGPFELTVDWIEFGVLGSFREQNFRKD